LYIAVETRATTTGFGASRHFSNTGVNFRGLSYWCKIPAGAKQQLFVHML